MTSLWTALPHPIIGLAPMDGVTDHPYRHVQKRYGHPALLCTEFVRAERLCAGEITLLRQLLYDESQRPLLAQLYGATPEAFRRAAVLLCRLGFDGIDINMGCPAKRVADSGAGAGLIGAPQLAADIVTATRAGVQDWQNGATAWDLPEIAPAMAEEVEARRVQLPPAYQQPHSVPVSVKTRIGYARPQVDEWIPRLLESAPDAVSIHGRTLAQGYGGQADWAAIGQAAELAQGSGTLILGSGDVISRADALKRAAAYGVDGVLIGRASRGNPFVFCPAAGEHEPTRHAAADRVPRLSMAREHAALYEKSLSAWPGYSFRGMHRHLGWYARGAPGARGLRGEFLRTASAAEVDRVLERYFADRVRWVKHDCLP